MERWRSLHNGSHNLEALLDQHSHPSNLPLDSLSLVMKIVWTNSLFGLMSCKPRRQICRISPQYELDGASATFFPQNKKIPEGVRTTWAGWNWRFGTQVEGFTERNFHYPLWVLIPLSSVVAALLWESSERPSSTTHDTSMRRQEAQGLSTTLEGHAALLFCTGSSWKSGLLEYL